MPIGKVWIYCSLFVCLFNCTVMDASAEDQPSGVKFCMVVHWRPGQGISHFGNFAPPEAQNRINSQPPGSKVYGMKAHCTRYARDAPFVEYHTACGRGWHVWI